MSTHKLPLSEERRRHHRVQLNLLGRFMLPNGQEYPCQVRNMSPGGVALITAVTGNTGEHVIAYIDEIGRIEGKIARIFSGGFAVEIVATQRKRDKLANQLTWLANRTTLGMPEDRRHDRLQPKNPYSRIKLPDGRTYACRVIDMSISGAAVAIQVRPALGTEIMLGRMRAVVVRHFGDGVAVQFSDVLDPKKLQESIVNESGRDGEVAVSA